MEVASAKLIGGADLGSAELTGNTRIVGGSPCRAQRQRVDVGGAELSGVVEAGEEACELWWGVRKPMGWSVWTKVARRRALRGMGASGSHGRWAGEHGARALEQSKRERSEGEQMGEGERVPARSPHLHESEAKSGGVNGAWRPCVGHVLSWTFFLSLLL
jgi:hypothetical protein